MLEIEEKNIVNYLENIGIKSAKKVWYNLSPEELTEHTLCKQQGKLTSTGTLAINTGKFTGRAPKDRFIVKDHLTKDAVFWGTVNQPFSADAFKSLYNKITDYFKGKEVYVRDAYVCTEQAYRQGVRVINEQPYNNLFAYNMFLRPSQEELPNFSADWLVINAPQFLAIPQEDGTHNENFTILNLTEKVIIIGGSGYTGEIKKGVFSALNFLLPHQENVLPMHCSANVGKHGDTALFFGLSGTGKTTLSTTANRKLIGDDEHGWSAQSVFNFEGGCYAKTINLSCEKEPEIYNAIKFGALLENVGFIKNSRMVDYSNKSITENTRVSYPLHFIENLQPGAIGDTPKNIFLLTCDAYGVLPPIAKLDIGQAMYYFISGYTAKVAGTEAGVKEPQATFSACFGAPFMPLHPTKYAEMLGEKIRNNNVSVWLINTGWCGGCFGEGKRIDLRHTRSMVNAILQGDLNNEQYITHPIFGLKMPKNCNSVPAELLNPLQTWKNEAQYYKEASKLAKAFNDNFKQYLPYANNNTKAAAPIIEVYV